MSSHTTPADSAVLSSQTTVRVFTDSKDPNEKHPIHGLLRALSTKPGVSKSQAANILKLGPHSDIANAYVVVIDHDETEVSGVHFEVGNEDVHRFVPSINLSTWQIKNNSLGSNFASTSLPVSLELSALPSDDRLQGALEDVIHAAAEREREEPKAKAILAHVVACVGSVQKVADLVSRALTDDSHFVNCDDWQCPKACPHVIFSRGSTHHRISLSKAAVWVLATIQGQMPSSSIGSRVKKKAEAS